MNHLELKESLEKHVLRSDLLGHPFLRNVNEASVPRDSAAHYVGQWWHPLHYFPTFLARTISVAESITVRTAVSRILFQELGEGRSSRAHELVYVATMRAAGFTPEEITQAGAKPATAALIDGYREASLREVTGIGFVYGTELADLAMVSAIGAAVRSAVGPIALEWVDIHVQQEPEHVHEADSMIAAAFSTSECREIVAGAEKAWALWIGFFDALYIRSEKVRATKPETSGSMAGMSR